MRFAASGAHGASPRTRFIRLSHLRKLLDCEQVAAVCYRIRRGEVEFLLVQTRGKRWTFPKGGVEPGLTHAQAAALEAFEEAGVHGRMEEAAFTQYFRRDLRARQSTARAVRMQENETPVSAHLCEVLRLTPPQEPGRNRTWFSPEKTKRRLCEGRTRADSAQFVRLVDRAVARIDRLRSAAATTNPPHDRPAANHAHHTRDPLQHVPFEAQPMLLSGMLPHASLAGSVYRGPAGRRGAAISVNTLLCDVLPLEETLRLALGPEANEASTQESEGLTRRALAPAQKARVLEIAGTRQSTRRARTARGNPE